MSTLADRLHDLTKDMPRGWMAKLARHCKITAATVSDWYSGKIQSMDGNNLILAAAFFKVNSVWLQTGKGNREPLPLISLYSHVTEGGNVSNTIIAIRGRVPLISLVAAGNWSEGVDNCAVGVAEEWIETTAPIKKHTYALRVSGDSMEPKFPHGAIIIVEPDEEAKNGSFIIVRQNGSDATFKQLIIDGSQKYLKPLNDRYPIMPLKDDAVMCGVVKRVEMDV